MSSELGAVRRLKETAAKRLSANEAKKQDKKDYYVDKDEDSGMWGVFGGVTGFCYSTYADKGDAEKEVRKMRVGFNLQM